MFRDYEGLVGKVLGFWGGIKDFHRGARRERGENLLFVIDKKPEISLLLIYNRVLLCEVETQVERMKMNLTAAEIDTINKISEPLLGHKAWNVKLGVGSYITMEFGDPVTNSRGKTHGHWHLWIYCCGWYLENPNDSYVGSEDPREIIKQKIIVLEGRSIENVIISPIAFETNFKFDHSLTLHTFPLNFYDAGEYWKLYTPQRKVLVLGPATKWSYEPSGR